MADADGRFQLVYNGEIYNYRSLRRDLSTRHAFRSDSDTEVLLYLLADYGIDALDMVEGMFAFAFWDSREDTLLIARDRFGEKPLYYCEGGEYFGFASSVAALQKAGLTDGSLSAAGLFGVPWLGAPTLGRTPIRGVKSLMPAHYLFVRCGRPEKEKSYWTISDFAPLTPDTCEEEILSNVDHLLRASVRDQLISDVPLGLFYSGGLDSSTVASYVREHHGRPLHTYSLGFDDLDYDESSLAAHGAEFFSFDHTTVKISSREAVAEIPTFLETLDVPLADGLNTYLVAKAAHKTFTVSLCGVGGDEAFCGYSTFRFMKLLERLRPLRQVLSGFPDPERGRPLSSRTSWPVRIRRFLGGDLEGSAAQFDLVRAIYTFEELDSLFTDDFLHQAHEEEPAIPSLRDSLSRGAYQNGRSMTDVTCKELQQYLGPLLLPAIDTMSMRFSMEIRSPFLNRRLIEYLMMVPDALKMPGLRRKRLLYKLMEDRLPQGVLRHKKRGFGIPLERWILKPGLREIVTEVVASKRTVTRGVFREAALQRALSSLSFYSPGDRMPHQEFMQLWIIYVIEEWLRRNCDG